MPLYTNTREGIFIQGPSPVESSSDVHRPENDLREHIANRLSRKFNGTMCAHLASMRINILSPSSLAGPETPQTGGRPPRDQRSPSEASEGDDDMSSTCFIDGLQEEIQVEGLQVLTAPSARGGRRSLCAGGVLMAAPSMDSAARMRARAAST